MRSGVHASERVSECGCPCICVCVYNCTAAMGRLDRDSEAAARNATTSSRGAPRCSPESAEFHSQDSLGPTSEW